METSAIYTLINLSILIVTGYISLRRAKFQNTVDDSTASRGFQETIINMQKEARAQEKQIKDLNDRLNHAHLDIELSVQVGETPIIKSWKWVKRDDTSPII